MRFSYFTHAQIGWLDISHVNTIIVSNYISYFMSLIYSVNLLCKLMKRKVALLFLWSKTFANTSLSLRTLLLCSGVKVNLVFASVSHKSTNAVKPCHQQVMMESQSHLHGSYSNIFPCRIKLIL